MSLATLVKSGRAAIAQAIAQQPLHLAWGAGDPAWDNPDASIPSMVNWTSLQAELGRRAPASVGFVTPDEAGDIVIPVGGSVGGLAQEARYKQVAEQTPYLYIRVNFDYENASNANVREIGLFMGTVLKPDLPPGQRYFLPHELQSQGLLVAAQIIQPAIARSPSVRQTVEFVLPI